MKKNKTIAYMMAAMLLVGGTFVGTKALFTDQVDATGEISISTGDVDIEVVNDAKWEIDRQGSGDENIGSLPGELADFDNLKYGDTLTKTIEIENKGTLKAVVSLNENHEVTKRLPDAIQYTAKFIDGKDNVVLNRGDRQKVELKIHVTDGGKHNESEKSINSDSQEQDIIVLTNGYTLDAKQVTK
ncbi:MAG: hypothetical protein E6X43_10855 [Peptostreptococcaceae bacterium]|nr:hypothetical protein [Peptostreptococcaceae bacterium]